MGNLSHLGVTVEGVMVKGSLATATTELWLRGIN